MTNEEKEQQIRGWLQMLDMQAVERRKLLEEIRSCKYVNGLTISAVNQPTHSLVEVRLRQELEHLEAVEKYEHEQQAKDQT